MSKRRRASELVYKNKYGFKWPVAVVAVLSGTGTATAGGVITINTAVQVYVTAASGTNIGTLIGTA